MLDFGITVTMPIKETVTTKAAQKAEDCVTAAQKTTPKRTQIDPLLKGVGGCQGQTVGGDVDELMLEVTCGQNQAALYMSRLQLGSKGTCVLFENSWLTPNEFQYISGRETAKDWKRSIKHHGKSLKVLISKGILTTSPLRCNCGQCGQGKDKDVSKYVTPEEANMASTPLRGDTFAADSTKQTRPGKSNDQLDQLYFRLPSESHDTTRKDDASLETTSALLQQRPMTEQCSTSHSQEGARYLSSCDTGVYGPLPDNGSYHRYENRQNVSVMDGYNHHRTAAGGVGNRLDEGHLANKEQQKLSLDDAEAKAMARKAMEGNDSEEQNRAASKCVPKVGGDPRKTGIDGNSVIEPSSQGNGGTAQKKCGTSGIKSIQGSNGSSWNQARYQTDQSYHHSDTKSFSDKAKKLGNSHQPMSSACVDGGGPSAGGPDKPSCSRVNVSPSGGKNSMSNTGSGGTTADATRGGPRCDASSFMFPSFGSPYYPMIPAPQLPAYYPNPYMWPVPFPTNPPNCSYGWTAPSEMTAPNCMRSPVKEPTPFDCNMPQNGGDQAFNFPWMKRTGNFSAFEPQSIRETPAAGDSHHSSGKRKLDCDSSDYFPPSKHPFYLSDNLRSAYGDTLGWPAYSPSAATGLDFRFLPYNIPSYIPEIRPTHGMFPGSFLKGSENPAAAGLGLFPGLFPSPCLGVNSR